MDNRKLFFHQTIQDTISLYFRLPIRQFDLLSHKQIFDYCKNIDFLKFTYETEQTFINSLETFLSKIPNFFEEDVIKDLDFGLLEKIHSKELEQLKKYLTFTRSSFSPFFNRALNESSAITTLKIVFDIYLIMSSKKYKEEKYVSLTFFNYTYQVYYDKEVLYVIGPVMIDKKFDYDDKRIDYIKNIKKCFKLQLHAHELMNLMNHRNIIVESKLNETGLRIVEVLKLLNKNFHKDHQYKKSELRGMAANFLYAIMNEKSSSQITTRVQNNQILRDLEGIEWFNDLSFNFLKFGTSTEEASNTSLDFLQIKLQADAYILCNYNHAQEEIIVEDCNISDKALKQRLFESIERSNQNGESIRDSFTYEVISDYINQKVPIKLVEEMNQTDHKLCNANSSIGSLLSIPLVFDKRVFAVLHFIGYEKFKFDEIDKRFLLKLASSVSKEYIEERFNETTEKMVVLLEGLHKKIDSDDLQNKTDEISKNIANVFSSDGVIIWLNRKEVYQTLRQNSELSILSEINFLDNQEDGTEYILSLEEDENLIKKNLQSDITVINDISSQCSNDENDVFFMKYKKEFQDKGITSLMFVSIKNYEGKFSGAVMLFDKSYRDYNQLSQKMLKRVTLHIGSILNTITYAKYSAKKLEERHLHESAQYINIINSRARDLENRIKKLYLQDNYEKYKLFLNIEDIKDFTAFTRKYLFTLFHGDAFVLTQYDEVMEEEIREIHNNTEYISIKQSLNQVLAVQKNNMNQLKDIIYQKNIEFNMAIKIPKQQFHDILNNVINNAIKYGKVGTQIKIWDELNIPYYYNIYIKNIGYHIQSIEKDRIFEKGVRGYITKTHLQDDEAFKESASQNKGLGLFFVKKMMLEGLKGNIKLQESKPIGDTGFSENTFVIKIPIKMVKEL